jgi:hypothetical protein
MSRRTLVAVVALSLGVLAGCGASAPPAKELADELIDTLEVDGVPVSDAVKECMRAEVESFQLTEQQAQGFTDFDDVAAKAAGGNELAKSIIDDFRAALASCN